MKREELANQFKTWKKRTKKLHSLDYTDEQIAPGKNIEDWMSLSADEMDMASARAKGDKMLNEALMYQYTKKKKKKVTP